jgi:ribosomal protein S11
MALVRKQLSGVQFFFGSQKKKARLHMKKSFSNIFITVTDLNNLVIFCATSGSADPSFSKKKKRSPHAVEAICRQLVAYLRFHKIKILELVLKLRVSAHVYTLLKELKFYGFIVSKIIERYRLPHNGVRKRRKPRK